MGNGRVMGSSSTNCRRNCCQKAKFQPLVLGRWGGGSFPRYILLFWAQVLGAIIVWGTRTFSRYFPAVVSKGAHISVPMLVAKCITIYYVILLCEVQSIGA